MHDFGDVVQRAALWRIAEARMLAQRVRDLLDSERYAPSDVVVLLRAAGDIGTFERALEDAGRAHLSRRGPRLLVASAGARPRRLAGVVANPDDDAAALRGAGVAARRSLVDALVLLADAAAGLAAHSVAGAARGRGRRRLRRPARADGARRRRADSRAGAAPRRRARGGALPVAGRADRPRRHGTGYDLRVLAMPGGSGAWRTCAS